MGSAIQTVLAAALLREQVGCSWQVCFLEIEVDVVGFEQSIKQGEKVSHG